MHGYLRQATASQSRIIGPFLDDTDFKTAETGLTIANTDVKLCINGAASVNKNSGGGTHRANGNYALTFDATDTASLGEIDVSVVVSGALQVVTKFHVISASEYDALFDTVGPIPNQGIVDRGTAQSSTSTTTTIRSAAAFGDNTLANAVLLAFGATQGYWQSVIITSNVGSTDVLTHPAFPVTLSGTITYIILAAPASNASLPVSADVTKWNGTAVSTPSTAGIPEVNLKNIANAAVSASTAQLGVNVVNFGGSAGTFASGIPSVNLLKILGTTLTETAGQIAAAFKQFFDVATPTGTMKSITNVVTATNLTNAPTSGDLTATMKTSVTTAATAATPALSAGGVTAVQSGLATASALSTVSDKIDVIDDYVDTEVAAILAAVDTEVAAIKTQTDKLTFTVANVLDANVQRINDVEITGDGQSGTEFGV